MAKNQRRTTSARTRPARKRAPARQTAKRRATAGADKMHTLIHELQVHAEEITVQNEQLIKAQHELERTRDRFADLYDFAPLGYLSINGHGVITEINLAGAALLGRERSFLLNLPVSTVVRSEYREAMESFLQSARARARARASSPLVVEAPARADARRMLRFIVRPDLLDFDADLFIAMIDVTDERRLERERGDALARERALAADRALEIAERTLAEARVKTLLERLVTAQEEERRRIARNLHDHLGQQLTALRLTLDSISHDAAISESLRPRLEVAEQIVSKMDRDVDLLAWDLRPDALGDHGLPAALSELVRQWTSVSQVPAEFHQSMPGDFRLPAETESNVYRIVQEALNNIAKHAAATQVSVLLEHRGAEAAVIIEDNGRGFDPDLTFQSRERNAVMGLIGMRERAALIDGDVQFESVPGQGTTVFVRIPVKRSG